MTDAQALELIATHGVAGLRHHIPTIQAMLGENRNWTEISKRINWDRKTARMHYEMSTGPFETRKLRCCLAESIETIRDTYYRDRWAVNEDTRQQMSRAYAEADKLLEGSSKEGLQ